MRKCLICGTLTRSYRCRKCANQPITLDVSSPSDRDLSKVIDEEMAARLEVKSMNPHKRYFCVIVACTRCSYMGTVTDKVTDGKYSVGNPNTAYWTFRDNEVVAELKGWTKTSKGTFCPNCSKLIEKYEKINRILNQVVDVSKIIRCMVKGCPDNNAGKCKSDNLGTFNCPVYFKNRVIGKNIDERWAELGLKPISDELNIDNQDNSNVGEN